MAFKTVEQFNEDKHRNKFVLTDDKESADVVFLYQSYRDMLVADAHYIRYPEYSGYVHCCGAGCPICTLKKADGTLAIKKQTRLFIPVYNINKINPDTGTAGVIEFWDRTPKFEQQFKQDVFANYPNPSEFVFKVIRHGVANDLETRYEIRAIGRNVVPGMSFKEILAKFNATMPDYYENIIKSYTIAELTEMMQTSNSNSVGTVTQDYVPIPRAGYQSSIPDTYVNASEAVGFANEEPEFTEDFSEGETEADNTDLPTPNF